jgi:hypothetical protein
MPKMGTGKRLGDCRYIDRKPTDLLAHQQVDLMAILKKNMKPQVLMGLINVCCASAESLKRSLINSRILANLEYSRHRSSTRYLSNIITSRMTHSYLDKSRLSI